MPKCDVLLIQPNVYHSKMGTISPWDVPSLGLAYLAAVLEQKGITVKITDAHILQLSLKQLKQIIENLKPKIIGITANGYSAKFAIITAHYIRRNFPMCHIVMGGPYPTDQYQKLLTDNICDVCVIGEGEYTFLELIENIENKNLWDNIDGIAFLNSSHKIIKTKTRELIQDLDQLPFPAWHLFPPLKKYKNLRGVTKRPYVPIFTSRGCPYSCNWCTKNIHGYKFRARSPENILKEIIHNIELFKVKEITIMDDSFTLNSHRIKELCILIKKSQTNIFFNFYSGIRADSIDESLMKYLISVGINRITVGIESGNQKIVNKIGKSLDLQRVLSAIKLAKKYRLISDGYFILGHPFDTIDTMEETIQFSLRSGLDHAYFFVAMPFHGTELFKIVEKSGKFVGDFSIGCNNHIVEGNPAFIMPQFTIKDVQKKYDKSYKSFYFRISHIFQLFVIYGRNFVKYRNFYEIKWIISQFLHLIKINFKRS